MYSDPLEYISTADYRLTLCHRERRHEWLRRCLPSTAEHEECGDHSGHHSRRNADSAPESG